MASLRMIAPGPRCTVQDLGRPGFQRFGIPIGGALDSFSLRAANVLVGNAQDLGALEMAYRGPSFVVEATSVRLGFFGGRAPIFVRRQDGRDARFESPTSCSLRLTRGDHVEVGSIAGSALLYMAVDGGFNIEPIMGSVSTYLRSGIGGWNGRALTTGDRLPLTRESVDERQETFFAGMAVLQPERLRVIDGPQRDFFDEGDVAAFYADAYRVGAAADRMGMKLSGAALRHARGYNIVSDGVAPGSIQVPGDGQPILLRCEHQTTGGYPKIATVISADLPALGRLAPGATIRFERITLQEAMAARRKQTAAIEGLQARLRTLPAAVDDMEERLRGANLISGVVDASLWSR